VVLKTLLSNEDGNGAITITSDVFDGLGLSVEITKGYALGS
jgi:hypothetical protein